MEIRIIEHDTTHSFIVYDLDETIPRVRSEEDQMSPAKGLIYLPMWILLCSQRDPTYCCNSSPSLDQKR